MPSGKPGKVDLAGIDLIYHLIEILIVDTNPNLYICIRDETAPSTKQDPTPAAKLILGLESIGFCLFH